ncbi:hypothetical protein TPA0910_88150 [Streptomyces hygroscopicus subsp. sporocinereus]|uniref:Integrase catalytic domain-containing protein n=1 Tax=Streptomyces hygroscopicus TaxID=1912 RepID=A0ABQ3UFK1_STRHY|nr:hypothetical protein TPA0910_88150 [Streptomyces hygroscopicus]
MTGAAGPTEGASSSGVHGEDRGARGGLPSSSLSALRGPAVRRLLDLRHELKLTTRHVRLMAASLEVTERTVRRWLAAAEHDEAAAEDPGARAQSRDRFSVTPEVRRLLALWKGNVAAVHRELTARAARGEGGPPPSIPTLHRAIHRDLTPGERAGLAGGERAARKHDVFLARPRGWRNQVWETDHVQVPVLVDVNGKPRRSWITWFTDCATNAITGVAVTPVHPSRESVLAALRSAVLREDPYGPFGGLPPKVRVDRGKDFLSRTVTAALDLLDVLVEDLPAYTPHLKGTVEGLNRAVEPMLLAALPGYTRQPHPGKRPSRPKDEVLLSFEDSTARLLDWTRWWNTEHRPEPLRGRTPLQAWQDDPTPLRDVPAADLWTFTLEDAGTRTLTNPRSPFPQTRLRGCVDDGSGRDPGPYPFHAPPRPPHRGLPRGHRPLPGAGGSGRSGNRGTGQSRTAGTGRPQSPSEKGPRSIPAGALRRRHPGRAPSAARRADRCAGRRRIRPECRHRSVAACAAGRHPARRTPGQLAHPGFPGRADHPEQARPTPVQP